MLLDITVLFIAGLVGGMLNAIAGGGTFITFPALLFVGVSPISANATNTFASCSGYISAAYALRKEINEHPVAEIVKFVVLALLGGLFGAWLLLQTPTTVFRETIPWLMLIATCLFTFGAALNAWLSQFGSKHHHISFIGTGLLALLLIGICIYGGFFNAGFGIIMLSYLVLAGYTNVNAMNGIKLLTSTCISITAIVLFIYNDAIAWFEGSAVFIGTLIGGYIAAHVSRSIPQTYIRTAVILIAIVTTIYFFFDVYY